MEKLELDTLDIHFIQIRNRFQNIIRTFAWKTKDRVDDHLDPSCPKPVYCIVKAGKRITAPDVFGCFFVDGLKPKFYPYRFDLIKGVKKLHHIITQAVRTRTDGQCHNVRVRDRFCKNLPEIFHRSIGIRICLKIGDIFMDRSF